MPKLTTLTDYPPDIQQRLLANADKWALKPGARPERKRRTARSRPRSDSEHGDKKAVGANNK
ncbi:hypothetical protein [Lysobacter soli]|uniref:hypothetical protein n=1 Tax=Lysobacter soli TaxID=453783 RepID=UPI003CF8C9F9